MTGSSWDVTEFRVLKYQDLTDEQKATVRPLTTAEVESAVGLGDTRLLALVDGKLERLWIDTVAKRPEQGYSTPYLGRTCQQTLIAGYPLRKGMLVSFGHESMVE